MGRIILGLIIIAVGFIFVWRPKIPLDFIGRSALGEKLLIGGSYSFYKFVGIVIIFVGILVTVGLQDNLIEFLLGGLL